MTTIDKSGMTPAGRFAERQFDAAQQLEDRAEEARAYLLRHPWCKRVEGVYFDRGIPQAVVFFCEIEPEAPADPAVWVVLGDLPPLYIDVESASTGAEAMDGYVRLMKDWVACVRGECSLEGFPELLTQRTFQPLIPSKALADALARRLEFIRTKMLPAWSDEIRPIGERFNDAHENQL